MGKEKNLPILSNFISNFYRYKKIKKKLQLFNKLKKKLLFLAATHFCFVNNPIYNNDFIQDYFFV